MRAVVQRVQEASVEVEGQVTGSIDRGLLVLVGVATKDTLQDADYLANKLAGLRVFPDKLGRMNLSVSEAGGSLLVVSQFTLYGDVRRGLRPSFDEAAAPEQARTLYEYLIGALRKRRMSVQTGVFQAHMKVKLVNDGPVTIVIDSDKTT
jgi:D-tyrosyl-tRNA(Tyr) deacylase